MSRTRSQSDTPGPMMRALQQFMPKFTPVHVWLYRALRGQVVNRATGGAPVLLLTTTGRRTGQLRTVAVGHLRDGDDVIVAGTNGGMAALPAWVLNLRANPEAEVEIGTERYPVRAEFLEGKKREHHWVQLITAYPAYEQAQRWVGREVPLVRLSQQAVVENS